MTRPTACREPFPFYHHRTMAEVMRDERRAEIARIAEKMRRNAA